MPRISIDTTDESPKRTPRKRAVRRVVTKSETMMRTPRTSRTAKTKVEEVSTSVTSSQRRAPTQLTASNNSSTTKKYSLVLALLVLMLGSATWIGVSDVGQIDVTARINEQNQKQSIANEETESTTGESVTIPVQNTPPAAISNIRPRGVVDTAPAPVPEMASTTEEIASSTEAVVEGGNTAEQTTEADTPVAEIDNTTPVMAQ